jgi:hypothetical protein
MGWTVLYLAFGVVALWLLGEVLLQYKARLRWRLLAFGGFLGVVVGVLVPSVPVIALGAIAFAVGQTFVTLSFRRGFSTGWAIGGSPGASRRRKSTGERDPAGPREPTLEVSDLAYEAATAMPGMQLEPGAVYEPQPLPDDTGQYGVYSDAAYAAQQQDQQQDQEQAQGQQRDQFQGQAQDQGQNYASYGGGYDPYAGAGSGYGQQPSGQDGYAGQYDYGTGQQQQYAAYSDPYVGGQQYDTYESYDSFGGQQQQQYADPYAQQQYNNETPPGGVWVPQPREEDQQQQTPPPPQEEPSPYGYGPGYNGQQPYSY